MKKYPFIQKLFIKRWIVPFVILVATIYGCRKEITPTGKTTLSITDPKVAEAKNWYENAYPISSNKGKPIHTNSTNDLDINQAVKPDWEDPKSYTRLGKEVIEMPFAPGAKLNLGLKTNNWHSDTTYARSYYLLLNDGQSYEAFILTIIADSGYVNSDFSKLAHNTYRKHDDDFSGLVLYSTPKGEFLGGYRYLNGQLLTPGSAETQAGTKTIQGVNGNKIKPSNIVETCVDWYTQVTIIYADGHTELLQDWTFDKRVCTYSSDGSSTGGGGGSGGGTGGGGGGTNPSTPPPPKVYCPAGSHPGPPVIRPCIPPAVDAVDDSRLTINYVQPPTGGDDGGLPPPPAQTCSVDPPRVPCPSVHDENLLPKNRLCSSTFKFSTVVTPDPKQNSRGWKEASVANLVINVVSDNYFENIWNVVTTGSSVVFGNFNLEIGVPGDIPDQAIVASASWAANLTIAQLEKSYGIEGLKTLIKSGTLGTTVARLMQIQLQSEIPGSRVGSSLSGRTVPTSPITGINCK